MATLIINPEFARQKKSVRLVSALAHELGHYYKRHLKDNGQIEEKKKELLADVYSGFWCQRANYPLKELIQAVDGIPENENYPPVKERKDSVSSGFKAASIPFCPPGWAGLNIAKDYSHVLSLFVSVSPSRNYFSFFMGKKQRYRVHFHLTSTDPSLQMTDVIKKIHHVTYTIDKTFSQPVFTFENQNNDDFGYLLTGVYGEFPIQATIHFTDSTELTINKEFNLK